MATLPPGTATAGASPTASAADPATRPEFAAYYGQSVSWSSCGDGFECTNVKVPLDWSAPSGETITLGVTRKKATGQRLGALFLNPGGPGVPGVEFLQAAAGTFGAALRRSYDLVSWDTRGIGKSEPSVACLPDSELDAYYAQDQEPSTPDEVAPLVEAAKEYVAACVKNSGPLLAHVDTISTVKDMDVLRAVLKDQTFTFYGASYGTFLGAWYAELFPWRVGRMVLDGVVDPNLTAAQYTQGQAAGFARAVDAYLDNCLAKRDCPLKGTREDAIAQLGTLWTSVGKTPLRTDQGRKLTQGLLGTGLLFAMYSRSYWDVLTQALTESFKGNGTTMLLLADSYLRRTEQGTYDPLLQVTQTIYCLDHQETRTIEQIASDVAALDKKYPPFGGTIDWPSVNCALWPHKAVVPKQPLTADGARPILVLGTTKDPATPYEWAKALASQLKSGRLLTREGDGHTGYRQGSKCTDSAVERYLVSGTLPAVGTICS